MGFGNLIYNFIQRNKAASLMNLACLAIISGVVIDNCTKHNYSYIFGDEKRAEKVDGPFSHTFFRTEPNGATHIARFDFLGYTVIDDFNNDGRAEKIYKIDSNFFGRDLETSLTAKDEPNYPPAFEKANKALEYQTKRFAGTIRSLN
jgi:hypothetical protein